MSRTRARGGETERFAFTWPGRARAIAEASAPARGRLEGERADGHLFVEADNLEALKLLRPVLGGRVRMIYIDPPYNTGEGMVYRDGFSSAAWLSMMYPRLLVARELLRDDGLIFVSIDDHAVHHLRLLLDDVFGDDRHLATFVWRRRSGAMDAVRNVSEDHEYVVCYGGPDAALAGEPRTFARYANPDDDPRGPWIADNLSAAKPGGDTFYAVRDPATGREYWPPKGRYWPYSPATMARKVAEGRVLFPRTADGSPMLKRFQNEARRTIRPVSTWIAPESRDADDGDEEVAVLRSPLNTAGTREVKALFGDKVFSYPKPVGLIRALVRQAAPADGDVVLDFFAGSCTTAQAVLEQSADDGKRRRFVMVQSAEPLPAEKRLADGTVLRTIADVGRERIRRVAARQERTIDVTMTRVI